MEKLSPSTIENNTVGKNESLMTLWPFLSCFVQIDST